MFSPVSPAIIAYQIDKMIFEQLYLAQKPEKMKEMLFYNELNLFEIVRELNYIIVATCKPEKDDSSFTYPLYNLRLKEVPLRASCESCKFIPE